ncbi:MAG: PQQ-binding-like beta-propeller repeat protein [Gemmatimonadales bacterium]
MRRGVLGAWSLAAAAGLVNAACGFARPIPAAPLAADSAHPAPLHQRWLTREAQGFLGPVAIRHDTVYGAGYDRRVAAVNLADGKVIWEYRMPGGVAAGVVMAGDTLFTASDRPDGAVVAVDRRTGKDFWKRRVGLVGVSLGLVGDKVMVAPRTGGLVALDVADGRVRWRRRMAAVVVRPLAGGPGEVIVATYDSLFRLSLADSGLRGGVRAPGPVSAPWVPIDDSLVLLATGNGLVSAIRRSDLRTEWTVQLDGPIVVTPTVTDDTIWVGTQSGTIYRIPLAAPRAERMLALDHPFTAPLVHWDSLLLAGRADGILQAFGPDGTERWEIAVGRPLVQPPLLLSDGFVVLGGRGDLHRFTR